MPISKIKSSSITADAASTNLNIDANTLFLDATNNRVGVGTSSPLQKLDVVSGDTYVGASIRSTSSGATNVALVIQDGTTGTGADGIYLGRTGAVNYLWTYENEPWVFASNNTERMRITAAGNVGIGTATIATKLVVADTGQSLVGTAYNVADFTNAGQTLGTRIGYDSSNGAVIASAGVNKPIAFWQYNTSNYVERMRLDSSGNLCVGTATALATASGRGNVTINGSGNSILVLGNGGAIAGYVFGDANSLGFSAGSGANSRVMTFDTNGIERARIDSSGNVGIGTTAPYTPLQVAGTIKIAPSNTTGVLAFGGNAQSATQLGIFRGAANSTSGGNFLNMAGYEGLTFSVSAADIGSQTERMRITNVGNLGVGTTAPLSRISTMGTGSTVGLASHAALRIQPSETGSTDQIIFGYAESGSYANAAIGFTATDYTNYQKGHIFFANRNATNNAAPTERVRITAPGEVLVGQTSAAQGAGISLQPNLATAAVGHSGSFATVWNIPTGTCGLFSVHLGSNGQYGGAALFFVTFGAAGAAYGNAVVTQIVAPQGDQSGYNWSWQIASNGQFQMRNNVGTVAFVPVINLITLG